MVDKFSGPTSHLESKSIAMQKRRPFASTTRYLGSLVNGQMTFSRVLLNFIIRHLFIVAASIYARFREKKKYRLAILSTFLHSAE